MSSGSSNNLTGGARVHRYNSEILFRIKPIFDSYKAWRCHPFIYEDIRAHHQGHWMHRMETNRIRQAGFILDQRLVINRIITLLSVVLGVVLDVELGIVLVVVLSLVLSVRR